MISEALQALKADRQFILFRSEPSKARLGKTYKIPCDYRTGQPANPLDPAIWLDADTASAIAVTWGSPYALGFVLTADCKRFCLDIDNCLAEGQWSATARQLCTMFPRAAVEVSQSGRGLHIWGIHIGKVPPHKCRNGELEIELYTEERFIALGQAGASVGDAATDCTAALQQLISLYFQPGAAPDETQEWTTAPCEKWCGPADDDELIQRALRSRSTSAAFGARASFADLWNANEEALGRTYPAAGRPYDASGADAALAQHLAFWTGADAERMRRLMLRSALARDKWEREDYLRRTITGACSRQVDVLADKPHVIEAGRRREQIEESMSIGDGADEIGIVGTMYLEEMLTRFVFIQDGRQVVDRQHPQHVAALADWKAALKASTTTTEVKGQFNYDGTPKTKTYETTTLWEKSPERQQCVAITFKAGGKLLTRDTQGREVECPIFCAVG